MYYVQFFFCPVRQPCQRRSWRSGNCIAVAWPSQGYRSLRQKQWKTRGKLTKIPSSKTVFEIPSGRLGRPMPTCAFPACSLPLSKLATWAPLLLQRLQWVYRRLNRTTPFGTWQIGNCMICCNLVRLNGGGSIAPGTVLNTFRGGGRPWRAGWASWAGRTRPLNMNEKNQTCKENCNYRCHRFHFQLFLLSDRACCRKYVQKKWGDLLNMWGRH